MADALGDLAHTISRHDGACTPAPRRRRRRWGVLAAVAVPAALGAGAV